MLWVITGPPCVGKSTWVRDRAQPGDMVIDLDRIALAITAETTPHHEYPPQIRKAAVMLRKQAVAQALVHARSGSSYIIHAKPNTKARAIYKKNQAQFVELTAPLQVLLDRAATERPAWVSGMIRSWYVDDEQD